MSVFCSFLQYVLYTRKVKLRTLRSDPASYVGTQGSPGWVWVPSYGTESHFSGMPHVHFFNSFPYRNVIFGTIYSYSPRS